TSCAFSLPTHPFVRFFLFLLPPPRHPPTLPPFPTRRSSDLSGQPRKGVHHHGEAFYPSRRRGGRRGRCSAAGGSRGGSRGRRRRSEEHTSELQSRFDLVCRLLLEKKKRSSVGMRRMRMSWAE